MSASILRAQLLASQPHLTPAAVRAVRVGDRVRDHSGTLCRITHIDAVSMSGGGDTIRRFQADAPYGGYHDTLGTHWLAERLFQGEI